MYDSLFEGLAFSFWSRKWKAASLATELFHLDHELEQDGFVCSTRPHLKGATRWCGVPGARPSSSATSAQLRQDAPYRVCNWAYFIERCTDSTFMRAIWPSSGLDLSKGLVFSQFLSRTICIKSLEPEGRMVRYYSAVHYFNISISNMDPPSSKASLEDPSVTADGHNLISHSVLLKISTP